MARVAPFDSRYTIWFKRLTFWFSWLTQSQNEPIFTARRYSSTVGATALTLLLPPADAVISIHITVYYTCNDVIWNTWWLSTALNCCKVPPGENVFPPPSRTLRRSLPFLCPHTPFSAHVRCGLTARWIKMPLGMEVDLGRSHIVLDGTQLSPPEGHSSPPFRPMSIVDKRSPISATAELLYRICIYIVYW